MYRSIALLLLAVATRALCAPAPQPDPLDSSECKIAREELERALNSMSPDRQAQAKRLALARKLAAQACLGRADTHRERSGLPDPAQAVAPGTIFVPSKPSPILPQSAPPPAPVIPGVAAITICDPAGCWDSQGRRLNNMGPFLMGPRGPCTIQGGTVNCP